MQRPLSTDLRCSLTTFISQLMRQAHPWMLWPGGPALLEGVSTVGPLGGGWAGTLKGQRPILKSSPPHPVPPPPPVLRTASPCVLLDHWDTEATHQVTSNRLQEERRPAGSAESSRGAAAGSSHAPLLGTWVQHLLFLPCGPGFPFHLSLLPECTVLCTPRSPPLPFTPMQAGPGISMMFSRSESTVET